MSQSLTSLNAKANSSINKYRVEKSARPTRAEAEDAVRTLISYIGENPDREGLVDTPARVIKSYKDFFSGYSRDPRQILERSFEEVANYNNFVVLRNVEVLSHCEHHMQPMLGKAHIAYLPHKRVVGISKLARVIEAFSRRLQSQETLTQQIGQSIYEILHPKAVAVVIEAKHQCMTTRGISMTGVSCVTQALFGECLTDDGLQQRAFKMIEGA